MILKAIILGIIEGITEFLPISSTGHLILVGKYLNLGRIQNVFDVVIQAGAILAVIIYFWNDIWPKFPFEKGYNRRHAKSVYRLWGKVIIAFFPAAIIGVLTNDYIDEHLFNSKSVAMALIVGAFLLLYAEKRLKRVKVDSTDDMTYSDALMIGIFQCLSLWPGMSRSASTIIGGLFMGLSRAASAEFSFYLAIPTIIGASVFKLFKAGLAFTSGEWLLIFIGSAVSFVVALIVVSMFMNYIKTKKLAPFAYYRIALGIVVLLSIAL